MSIAQNLARVHERIAAAARRAGRAPEAVALMAVSKTFPAEAICEAYHAGLRLFGENKVQEFAAKYAALHQLSGASWHLIGHLQTNKAAKAAELFGAVDSVDSVRVMEKLNAAAARLGKIVPVLLELKLGGEVSKTGVSPDSSELEQMLDAAARLENIEVRGLMTVPPYSEDPEGARPYFRRLRQVREDIARRHWRRVSMEELSMGMSHDFEVAIEEGSTCVRIGTAIFGERTRA